MNVTPLLDFIARYESRGNYDAVWGGIAPRDHPPRPLTRMMIGEVLDWQDSIDARYRSEAAGRYQIMEDTLRGLIREAGLSTSDHFDARAQDILATALLRRRGLMRYLRGEIAAERFANAIAREWASMPVVTDVVRPDGVTVRRGSTYYAGDGLNKAHADPDQFLAAVRAVKP